MFFPLPLPVCCRESGKRKREVAGPCWLRGRRCSATGEAVSVGGFDDEAGGGHGSEALIKGSGADTAGCPQFGERPGLLAVGKGCGDALIDGSWFGSALGLDRLKGKGVGSLDQFKRNAGHGGSSPMLDGQDDTIVTVTPKIEVGITPGMELRRSAQGLPSTDGPAPFLAVDKDDGDGVAALQFAQEGEQWCHIAAGILIDAMQPHERIEDQQPRFQPGDGFLQPCPVGLESEAQTEGGDHLHVEFGENDAGGGADTFETAADDVQGVFGGIEQDAAGTADREAAQAGDAGGDGDGQIEGEEGFAAFGFAADDADGLFRPQSVDEPALLFGAIGEPSGRLDRKRAHRRRRIAALVSLVMGTAQVSKNSVSSIWRASR